MRWILLTSALLGAWPTPSPAEPPPVDRSLLWRSEEAFGYVLPDELLREWPRDAAYGYDVDHVDLEMTVLFGPNQIDAIGTLTVTISEAGLTEIPVDLDNALVVDRVTVDGAERPFVHGPDQIAITLASVPEVGTQLAIGVEYHGTPVLVGNKSMRFSVHSGVPIVYTLSTPYSTATSTVIPVSHYWRPCKDMPDDKSTFSFSATVPDTMLACSNGMMISNVDNGNGTRTMTWEHGFQVAPYLITMGATNYVTIEDLYQGPGGTALIQHFVFPERYNQALVSFDIVPEAIACYASLFGEYPFIGEKYGMFATMPGPAVEEQTMVAYPYNLITGTHQYDWIVVHELAHMWWGDCVTCASWEHVWLNEGLASYSEALWREHLYGFSGLRSYMLGMDNGPYAGTVYDPPYIWNAIVYEKAAWVFHMLRHILGDEHFFQFLLDYRAAHEYGVATTEDLIDVAETVYGGDMRWFFDSWIYEEGRPTYSYSWTHHGDGPYTVVLAIEQVQSPSYPTYKMPIDVSISTTGGTFTGVLCDSLRTQWFSFEVDDEPTGLILDPDDWILASFTPGTASASSAARGAQVLAPSSPNPFRSRTSIRFELAQPGTVALRVFDLQGRMVRTLTQGPRGAGAYAAVFDGRNDRGEPLPAGAYFCRLVGPGGVQERRMVLLK